MAKQGVGNTAIGAATCRLIEQYQPNEFRLFNEPLVKDLVGTPIRILMQFASVRNLTVKQMDAITEGIYGTQVCRTRYIDDTVQTILSQGIKQCVILGAGLDTRAYRLTEMEQVKVFEVDLPAVQNNKKKEIEKHFGHLPENITYIPIDFDTQTLEAVFTSTAYEPSKPTLFIWEGVTQYISEEAVRKILSFVGKSASGSIIVFSYVLKSIIERRSDIPNADKMMDAVAKRSPWIFGLEPSNLQKYLQPFHLALITDVENADYQEKYLKPLKRNLTVFKGEHIVQATVTRS
jgi:methyltransferase (TIGR00027 family)